MKTKKGVSLIVLSITILVMAILAATVIIALEDTGIIGRSKNTAAQQNYTQEYTRLQVIKNGILTDNFGEITVAEYINKLKEKGIIEEGQTTNADSSITVTTKTGFLANLMQDGESNIIISLGTANATIALNPTTLSGDITSGDVIKTITATTTNVTGNITWTSSNPNVATVTGSNEVAAVTLKANGTATITATYGNAKATCEVTVTGTVVTPVITLNKTTISKTITTGSTATETLTATTQNITGTLTWTSSNTSVATVSGSGNSATVTMKAGGTAIITATNGNTSASCTVVVTENTPTPKITLSSTSISRTLSNGVSSTATLTATTQNISGTLTWTSSNTSVATVTSRGNTVTVTMKAAGTATITAKYGTTTATCIVRVTESYTIAAGTYTFAYTLTAPSSEIRENITFVSNGTTFSAMQVNTKLIYSTSLLSETAKVTQPIDAEPEVGFGLYIISPGMDSPGGPTGSFDGVAYSYGSWYSKSYMTITINSTQSVSKSFYNWFMTNASATGGSHNGGSN